MKQNKLAVAVVQSNLIWENPKQNRLQFTQKINAIETQVDLFVLPEMFTTGFTMNTNYAETMKGETVLWMQNIAQQKQVALAGSIIVLEDDKYYNRLLFVYPNGKMIHYDKHHLFALSGEDTVFTSGVNNVIVNYKGWNINLLICYDLRFPEWSRNTQNYDILLYVASWPKKRITAWDALLKARAIENMSYTIGVNRIGVDSKGLEYIGHTVILDALGTEMSTITSNKEQIGIINLELDTQQKLRKKLGFLSGVIPN